MLSRHATAAAVLTLATLCACGSSDDDGAAPDTSEAGVDETGPTGPTEPARQTDAGRAGRRDG